MVLDNLISLDRQLFLAVNSAWTPFLDAVMKPLSQPSFSSSLSTLTSFMRALSAAHAAISSEKTASSSVRLP